MIVFAFQSGSLLGGLAAGYVAAGVGIGLRLRQRGYSEATAISALVAWPALMPLLQQAPAPSRSPGPLGAKIDRTFAALQATLTDPAAGEVPFEAEFDGLCEALHRADGRLALADRLLASAEGTAEHPGIQALQRARAQAAAEIEAVLAEVVQLRLQVGLAALAGDAHAVRDRLVELLARTRALEEVTQMPELTA